MVFRSLISSKNILSAFLLLIYFILTIVIANNCELTQHRFLSSLLGLSLPLFILSCGRIVACIAFLPLWGLISVHLYILSHYHKITYDICAAIASTDTHEALSMLHTVPLTLLLMACLASAGGAYLAQQAAALRHKRACLCLLILCSTFVYGLNRPLPHDITGHYTRAITYDPLRHAYIHNTAFETYLPYYINLPGIMGNTAVAASLKYSSMRGLPHQKPLSITAHHRIDPAITHASTPKERNIIFVIGESDLASHHTLYGYDQYNTTPEINHLSQLRYLCAIANAHSAASMTHHAVPMMLSFYSPTAQDKLVSEANLIELATQQGFQTLWIGTQEASSLYGSAYGYISEFSQHFIRPDRTNLPIIIPENNDDTLLPIVKTQLEALSKKQPHFIIIHLIGNHAAYTDRRTKNDQEALPHAGSYDQAVHHTDHILGSIIRLSQETLGQGTLLYSADHGEYLSSPEHGEHGIYDGGYDQYTIPVYIAGNNHLSYCRYANSLRSPHGDFSQLMEKYILLTMMGYTLSPTIVKNDVLHDIVLHADGKAYPYRALPQPRVPQR